MLDNTLFLITARGGSKGIPFKNIKLLGTKPLIAYSLELARKFTTDIHICLSTDDAQIAEDANKLGLGVPFMRPEELATDTAGSFEVIRHALQFYLDSGVVYDKLVLLQPTSPFRREIDVQQAIAVFEQNAENTDIVTTVFESMANPYYNLMEENEQGFLQLSKGGIQITRRQDAPKVFEQNGAVYVINTKAFRQARCFDDLKCVRKSVMPRKYSLDIDTSDDWEYAEYLIKVKNIVNEL